MVIAIIVSCVIILDQAAKFFALKFLPLNTPVPLIDNFIYLTLVHNRGAAFGLFQNRVFLFILAAIFAIALILHNLKNKQNSFLFKLCLALILAGAIGNLIDRVRLGYVVDFIDLRFWPVFNLADSMITIAAVILSWELLFKSPDGKSRPGRETKG